MSRRRAAEIKNITPDANYKSIVIAKFINYLMQNGKKAKAEKIVYESIDNLSGKIKKEPVEAFEEIVDNLSELEVIQISYHIFLSAWYLILVNFSYSTWAF